MKSLNVSILAVVGLAAALIFSGCGGSGPGVAGLTAGSVTSGTTSTTSTTSTSATTGATTGLGSLTVLSDERFFPEGLDDSGRVLARDSSNRYFFFQGGAKTFIPDLPGGETFQVVTMNFRGTVLGSAVPSGKPYLFKDGVSVALAVPAGLSGPVTAINMAENDTVIAVSNGKYFTYADPNTPVEVTLPERFEPRAINSSGRILGVIKFLPSDPDPSYRSDRWHFFERGVLTSLGVMVGADPFRPGSPCAINDGGTMVVKSSSHSVIFSPSGVEIRRVPFHIGSRLTNDGSFSGSSSKLQFLVPSLFRAPEDAFLASFYFGSLGFYRSVKQVVDLNSTKAYLDCSAINNSHSAAAFFHDDYQNSVAGKPFLTEFTSANFADGDIDVTVTGLDRVGATGQIKFTADVAGTANTAVTWSIVESGAGTISADGTYTAPAKGGTYTVKAVSVANTSRSDTKTVTVISLGGDSGPTYGEPAAVQGPGEPFTITNVKPNGNMVGYTNGETKKALFWASPSAAPQQLAGGSYQSVQAIDTRNGVIVGLAVSAGETFSVPVYWDSVTSSPTPLGFPVGSFLLTDWISINDSGQIVCGSLYYPSRTSVPTRYAEAFVISSTTARPFILDDGSIIIADSGGAYRFASPTAEAVQLSGASSFLGRIFGASIDGTEVVGRSGSIVPGVPTRWRSSNGFAVTALSTPSIATALATLSVGGNTYGAATYSEGTTGIAVWSLSGAYADLRAMITNPSGWTLTSPAGVTSNGTVVMVAKPTTGASGYYFAPKL
jgi:hypothetical protein